MPNPSTNEDERLAAYERGRKAGIAKSTSLTPYMQTAMVFAARYTHDRATGGTLVVVRALESCWHQLTKQTQEQILEEAKDATTNLDDWERLRAFVANKVK